MDDVTRERFEWLRHKIDYYGRYHDHKETMAWVATAFYLGGIIGIAFGLNHIISCVAVPIVFTIAALLVLPIPLCKFLNMQFDRRWIANEMVKVFDAELGRLLNMTVTQLNQEQADFANLGCDWPKLLYSQIKERETHRHRAWTQFLKCKGWPEDPYPLRSELATYLAIFFVTVLAIVLIWLQHLNS